MKKKQRFSITIDTDYKICSGSCTYCVAASTDNYKQGVDKKRIVEDCNRIDRDTYKYAKFDFDNLAKTLNDNYDKYHPEFYTFDIWMLDPVTCFSSIREIIEFLEYWIAEKKVHSYISTSTNGLPLLDSERANWLHEHNVGIQLSHDGLGQKYRTGEYDPLPDLIPLIRNGTIDCINATLTKQNYSPLDNIKYFNSILEKAFPEIYSKTDIASEELTRIWKRFQIKLNHIYDGKYDNYDPTLTGRELDIYLHDWAMLFNILHTPMIDNLYYHPYAKYIKSQSTRYSFLKDFKSRGNPCRNFQIGIDEESEHLNACGDFIECNLVEKVANSENILNENCKGCKYELSKECNMCGAMFKKDNCEYFYRWNQLLEIEHQRQMLERQLHGTNHNA